MGLRKIKMSQKLRCGWVNLNNPLYIDYHDKEWGKPLYDDKALFELLCLEGAQAGLSWQTILNRRAEYRKCFWDFDVDTIIKKSDQQLLARMEKFGIIKNKLKVLGVKKNAQAYKKIVDEHGSLSNFLWSFVGGKPVVSELAHYKDGLAQNEISTELSKSLKKYGFTFVGPVICYAFMQAAGLVDDHEQTCFAKGKNKH